MLWPVASVSSSPSHLRSCQLQHPHEQTSLEVVSVGLLLNHVLGHDSLFLDRVFDIVLLAVPDRLFPANTLRGSSTNGLCAHLVSNLSWYTS